MIYTLCWKAHGWMQDIKVNRAQRISETIYILRDAGILPGEVEELRIFSKRRGEYVHVDASYEEEDIYQGDVLSIE